MRTFLTDLEQVIKRKLKSAENSHVFLTIFKLLVLQILDITISYAFDFVIKFYGLFVRRRNLRTSLELLAPQELSCIVSSNDLHDEFTSVVFH